MLASNCCSNPVSYAATEKDCTSGLNIAVFDDLDRVGTDVVLLHGCPQSCMPNPVEDLDGHEDMVEVLLVWKIFLTDSQKTHHQQVMVTSSVCSRKTLCSGNVHSRSETLPP